VATDTVEILSDGSDGGAARIRVSGVGGDFLTLLGVLNRASVGSNEEYLDRDSPPRVRYETIYELEPGARHVVVRFRLMNLTDEALEFPGEDATGLLSLLGLDLEGFTLPVGDVALFGATSDIFAPGAGFDMRFALEDAYARGIEFPAFAGLVTDWLASRGSEGVSYGMLAAESELNFANNKRELYEGDGNVVTDSSLLIPVVASSFVGVFYSDAPAELAAGESFEVVKYFVLGSGDVGSVLDEFHHIRGVATGRVAGMVLDQVTGRPALDTSVLVYQRNGSDRRIYSQYNVQVGGQFGGTLEPGEYSVRLEGPGRPLSEFVDFSVSAETTTSLVLSAPSPGRILATVIDPEGRRLPARVTVVGRYDASSAGENTRDFLFDLEAGQSFRYSDMVPDDPEDSDTLRYIEAAEPTHEGIAELLVRPGSYEVVASRGPEYSTFLVELTVEPGQTQSFGMTIERVMDTTGWIAADMHIHTRNSIDSALSLDGRSALAAEGIEWSIATDHNYVTDFARHSATT
jgi:hypothetical protein